ncbi:MAG: S24/S26 family peptidase [Nanoarchaeota archaeon]|nr:S24/S26 family peptidase [Nanoarchaeota archaeon]
MIYDKNQFTFNMIFLVLVIAAISVFAFFGRNYYEVTEELRDINLKLSEIEDNQNMMNYIQGGRNPVDFQLTPTGFFVTAADDYGILSGSSMQPAIFDGNILIEKKYVGQKFMPGQIVRYLNKDGVPVVHRVRAVYDTTLFVQGDNLDIGEVISKTSVTHIVVGVIFT